MKYKNYILGIYQLDQPSDSVFPQLSENAPVTSASGAAPAQHPLPPDRQHASNRVRSKDASDRIASVKAAVGCSSIIPSALMLPRQRPDVASLAFHVHDILSTTNTYIIMC
ncbi:jg9918 [Pararge aegeria aegeria]|uniref:Jg9918 protein n=1 Tax=Pararge aegeria aegeria TaxID=348720 RepID=A0A8S4RFA6_9NEOP|nr:jg9918 [Pararge aegeria aegeria]